MHYITSDIGLEFAEFRGASRNTLNVAVWVELGLDRCKLNGRNLNFNFVNKISTHYRQYYIVGRGQRY